jgi:hypothetical protein
MTISYDKQVLIKRGNTASVSTYVGPLGELVLNTDTNQVYVHDGATAGGILVGDGVGSGNISINNLQIGGTVTGNLIPSANVTYSLGSPTAQWRDLWVSGNTIHIGGTAISVNESGQIESSGGFVVQNSTLVGLTDLGLGASLEAYEGDIANNVELRAPTDGSALLVSNDSIKAAQTSIGVQGDLAFIAVHDAESNLPAFSWLFKDDGNLQLPVGGDIVNSNGASVLGGAAGPAQPYLELTSTPFITQPAILTQTVTVTAAPFGVDARLSLIIAEGPTLDVETITVTTAGTGYVVGQQYRIEYWQIGGSNDESSIDFEVATVGPDGELLTITNVAFVGSATNTPGTYTNLGLLYQPSVFDEIDTGLVLTRGRQQGIFNIAAEAEYDNDDYLSPLGTEWNSDGWGNLLGLGTRSYGTWRDALNNRVGNNIVGAELVMHDTINDKYYKFEFTEWGGNDGGFAYTRTLVEDPNYFRKTDYGDEVDEISEGLHITRGERGWLYNPLEDEGYDDDTPTGSLWNNDGWDDLSNVESRTYQTLEAIWDNNFNEIAGARMVMKDTTTDTDTYWAIHFLSWTQGQNGGGVSYLRYELDLDQLQEGVTFADGTVLKSAQGLGRVKSTAPGNRRIEEAVGYKQVSVTEVTTSNTYNVVSIERPSGSPIWDLFIDRATNSELEAAVTLYGQYGGDDHKWRVTVNGQVYIDDDLQIYLSGSYIIIYSGNEVALPGDAGLSVTIERITGGDSVVWWDKNELPGGGNNFRGAVIDYHAYTGESTIIGTIHIVDDDGEEHITHTEVTSGSTDGMNDNLWIVTSEGRIRYGRFDSEAKTLKIHWTAKVFYGSELYD